jgi:hypothetical protein
MVLVIEIAEAKGLERTDRGGGRPRKKKPPSDAR